MYLEQHGFTHFTGIIEPAHARGMPGAAADLRTCPSCLRRPLPPCPPPFSPTLPSSHTSFLPSISPTHPRQSLAEFQGILEAQDKQAVPLQQQKALDFVSAVEEAMVKGFPFEVPKEYADLPQLKVSLPAGGAA